jgi:hypothetical protein
MVSSGAKVTMSAPSFSDAVFLYDGGHLQMSVSLHYYFNIQLFLSQTKCFYVKICFDVVENVASP